MLSFSGKPRLLSIRNETGPKNENPFHAGRIHATSSDGSLSFKSKQTNANTITFYQRIAFVAVAVPATIRKWYRPPNVRKDLHKSTHSLTHSLVHAVIVEGCGREFTTIIFDQDEDPIPAFESKSKSKSRTKTRTRELNEKSGGTRTVKGSKASKHVLMGKVHVHIRCFQIGDWSSSCGK